MCRGEAIFSIFSKTLPQLEPSYLQPPSVLHHRHLLQTTCYNHLLLLLTSREENRSRNKLRTPLSRGLRSQKGFRPTTGYTYINNVNTIESRKTNGSKISIVKLYACVGVL